MSLQEEELNVRVLTWNVWGIGPKPEERSVNIVTELDRVNADLMGFQEVIVDDSGESYLDEYARQIGGAIVYGPGPDGFESPMRNAILSRRPIRSSGAKLLSADGPNQYRTVVMAEVDVAGDPLRFYTTHLEHRFDRGDLRARQLSDIVAFIQSHDGSADFGHGPILAGDLNCRPESDEVRRMTGASEPFSTKGPNRVFIDAWDAVGSGDGLTYSSNNPLLKSAQWPNRRLDYVLAGYPMPKGKQRLRSAELVGTTTSCSDHYGVVVEFSN